MSLCSLGGRAVLHADAKQSGGLERQDNEEKAHRRQEV